MVSEKELLQEILDDIKNERITLPTLPEVALKVRDAIEDENTSAQQIADIIATDTAVSARLLQIVNSPIYRAHKPIDNLKNAIARLGYTQVRNLVTSLVMKQMFQATDEVLDTRLRRLWEHGVQVAAIASVLSAQIPGMQKEQALLAGLIHDIGALPILVKAEEIPELLDNEDLLDQVVRKLHTKLGAKIMQHWKFPDSLIDVVEQHETLDRNPGSPADYVDLVIVANLQSYIGTDHPHSMVNFKTVPAFNRLGIDSEIQVVEIEENRQDIEDLEKILLG